MTIAEMQNEVLRLKREKKITVLAHTYIGREIAEIADYTGDSFALARAAQTVVGDVFM